MRKLLGVLCCLGLGGCGGVDYVDRYERSVYAYEPVYCYETLGDPNCYRQPYHRDEDRLVNYYGPHPSVYSRSVTEPPLLVAPPQVDCYIRDRDRFAYPSEDMYEVCQRSRYSRVEPSDFRRDSRP